MHPRRARAEAATFRALMKLPPRVMRRLAGPPVVVDGQTLDLETQLTLRMAELLHEPAVETLPWDEARDTVRRHAATTGGTHPVGETRNLSIPGADGSIGARLYVPRSHSGGTGPAPLLVFLHGGGLMYGDLDSHDAVCRFLAERADVLVLAVDYRLAPEHPFPAAVDDCWAAYTWVASHADQLGADVDRLAVGGDSAGGHLSAVVALKAGEAGVPCAFQLLVYPVTDMAEQSRSRGLFRDGFYLTAEFTDLAERTYLGDHDRRDPLASVLYTEKFPEGVAPALVLTAGFDPLRDEGEAYARLLEEHGVTVEAKRYPSFIHGFFNMVGAGRSTRAAVAEIAVKLKAALG
jgi:acetyl esterase